MSANISEQSEREKGEEEKKKIDGKQETGSKTVDQSVNSIVETSKLPPGGKSSEEIRKETSINWLSSGTGKSTDNVRKFYDTTQITDKWDLKLTDIGDKNYSDLTDQQLEVWNAAFPDNPEAEWNAYKDNMKNLVILLKGRVLNFTEAFKSYLPKTLRDKIDKSGYMLSSSELEMFANAFNEISAHGGEAKEPSNWEKFKLGSYEIFRDYVVKGKIFWTVTILFSAFCITLSSFQCSKDIDHWGDIPTCIINHTGCEIGKMFSGCYIISPDGMYGKMIYAGGTDVAPSSSPSDIAVDNNDGGGVGTTCNTDNNCDCDGNIIGKCDGCSGVVTSGDYAGWTKVWTCDSLTDSIPKIITGGADWVTGEGVKILIIILISFLVFGLIVFIWRWATKPKSKDSNSKFKFRKRKKYKRIKK